jgi:hypothetical protein
MAETDRGAGIGQMRPVGIDAVALDRFAGAARGGAEDQVHESRRAVAARRPGLGVRRRHADDTRDGRRDGGPHDALNHEFSPRTAGAQTGSLPWMMTSLMETADG